MVPFVSVDNMSPRASPRCGTVLAELTDAIEADFRAGKVSTRRRRVASHSRDGVIELMPTSDGRIYSFKYVNGAPENTAEGLQTVTAFGLLARFHGLSGMLTEMTILTALRNCRNLGNGCPAPGAEECTHHGYDWQRRAGRVPGPGE